MVATGPLGENQPDLSGDFKGVGTGDALTFRMGVRGDIANPTYGIKGLIIKQP